MKELIVNNLLSLFGVLVGAYLSKYLTTKSGKRDFLFELHKEFNNTEMSNHRSIADALIMKYPDKGIQELETIDINSVTSFYVIMRYYQRLWIAVKFKQVDNKYILELFPDVFYYWYYVSFNDNLLQYDWVHVYGIDYPESGQDYGNVAKRFASDLIFGKQVYVEDKGKDRYERQLGIVYVLPDSVCLNTELLKAGLAWHYKYFDKNQEWGEMEQQARDGKIGLWERADAVAPWEWRRQ